jgi:hypothetical protein
VSHHPFVTRVSRFDVIDGVWVAILAPCNRCTEPDRDPNIHSFVLPEAPSRNGGGLAVQAPCKGGSTGRRRARNLRVRTRDQADGGQMLLVWTAEIVDAAESINWTPRPKHAPFCNVSLGEVAR